MVLDGRVAALWGGGAGWPGFVAVTSSKEGGRFIAPSADERARILARHGFLKTITQAGGRFPNQKESIVSIGSWSFVMVRPALDEAIVLRLARALHAAEATPPPQLVDTTAKSTLAALADPNLLHPGVLAYYRQAGLTPKSP